MLRTFEQRFYAHCLLSAAFLVIPWMLNLRQLIKSEEQWSQDAAISDRVTSWLFLHSKKLLVLTALCGSAYSAIELCNSRAFALTFFTMVCLFFYRDRFF